MRVINFRQLWDVDIVKSVEELLAESGKFKREIIRSSLTGEDAKKDVLNRYVSFIYNILKTWEDYSVDLKSKMSSSKGSEGVRTIAYSDIKEFVYTNNDYASILKFVDGIINGIGEDNEFDDVDDIKDFFVHTVNAAFDDRGDTTADVLNSVLTTDGGGFSENIVSIDKGEAKLYDTVKGYNKLFNSDDYTVLYKSITKTIDFISSRSTRDKYLNPNNMKMFVAIVNNIIEYISYSITVFITRIFAIQTYAYPFIMHVETNFHESVDLPGTGESATDTDVNIMKDIDEAICKSPDNYNDLIDALCSFTTSIGADPLFGNFKPTKEKYLGSYKASKNKFSDGLLSNTLDQFLSRERSQYISTFSSAGSKGIAEMHQILKSCIYNSQQGIQGISNSKQEILHVIRGTEYDHTTKGCQQAAADLLIFMNHMCGNIVEAIRSTKEYLTHEYNKFGRHNSLNNDAEESCTMLDELYRDISSAIIQRGRDIEIEYNKHHKKDVDKLINDLSIKIPGKDKVEETTSNVTNAVPDTTRIPLNMIDMYSLPAFESAEMYDMYLRTLPLFENDVYLSEASGQSTMINKLQSLVLNIFRRWETIYGDRKFQEALNYVNTQQAELEGLVIPTDAQMTVFPYKDNVNINGKVFTNVINALNGFDQKILEKEGGTSQFVQSMYPSDKVYEWFTKDDANVSKMKYMNYVLFQEEAQVNDAKIKKVTITGKDIKAKIPEWIKTVQGTTEINQSMSELNKQMGDAFKKFKDTVISASSDQNQNKDVTNTPDQNAKDSSEIANAANAPTGNNNTGNSSTTTNTNSSAMGESVIMEAGGNPMFDTLIVEVQKVINSIVTPTVFYMVNCVTSSYKYIQDAYKLGHQQASAPVNTQNNQ